MLSATANTAKPAATSAQVRSNRHPVKTNVATASASRSRSASGYARLVATTSGLPPVVEITLSKITAAPKAATAREAIDASPEQERQGDEADRIEREVERVADRRDRDLVEAGQKGEVVEVASRL